MTVCCVLAEGPVSGYSPEYVVRLERMVRRHLARPFRFVCLTDGTRGTVPCETITIPRIDEEVPDATKGIWQKLQVFNRAHGFTGRMLYLDLDTLVVASLDPIVDCDAPFALTEDAMVEERRHITSDRYGRLLVRRFNSSVMVWDAGRSETAGLYDAWSVDVALEYSTDQDWIGNNCPGALGLPLAWFPRISQARPPWPAEAKVVLCKKPKPHHVPKDWGWFDAAWGGWTA